jgi:hypothetical protein
MNPKVSRRLHLLFVALVVAAIITPLHSPIALADPPPSGTGKSTSKTKGGISGGSKGLAGRYWAIR